jgi:hypothetical protein
VETNDSSSEQEGESDNSQEQPGETDSYGGTAQGQETPVKSSGEKMNLRFALLILWKIKFVTLLEMRMGMRILMLKFLK